MKTPKILIWDLECSDLNADIGHIISIGYMFLGDKKPTVISILQHPGKALNDDSQLIKAFEDVYNSAEVTVAHFGGFFDLPFLQTRRLIHGMQTLDRIPMVDTWRIAKKRLRFGSNRLERILEVLGCPYQKTPVKLSVWALARCGDKKAISYVVEHNRLDVLVLDWVYRKLKPFWEHHPAVVPKGEGRVCNKCGSESVKSHGRRYLTENNIFQRLRCGSCGHTWKGDKIQ